MTDNIEEEYLRDLIRGYYPELRDIKIELQDGFFIQIAGEIVPRTMFGETFVLEMKINM